MLRCVDYTPPPDTPAYVPVLSPGLNNVPQKRQNLMRLRHAPDCGSNQAAIESYTRALGMCPDHDDGLVARGAAFATTGRLRQAVQDLSRALSLNPQNVNAASYLRETRRCADVWALGRGGEGRCAAVCADTRVRLFFGAWSPGFFLCP